MLDAARLEPILRHELTHAFLRGSRIRGTPVCPEIVVEADEDLRSGEVVNIRVRAGEHLMKTGYIPETVIDKVNGWLADYRAGQSQDAVNVAE